MPTQLTDFLLKFADNAHLGKVATDLTPGAIVTLAVLILLSGFTHLEIFPYARLREYHERAQSAHDTLAALDRQAQALQDSLAIATAAQRSRIDVRLKQVESRRTAQAPTFVELTKQEQEAATLAKNLDILSDHFMSLFIVGFLVGFLMAQVSGAVFYNGLFYRYFKRNHGDVNKTLYSGDDAGLKNADRVKHRTITYYQLKVGKDFVDRLPDLEVNYYRYLEVAMNLIVPLGLLAIALGAVGLSGGTRTMLLFALLCILATVLLYRNARAQYVGYMLKKADVIQAVQEEGGFKLKLPRD